MNDDDRSEQEYARAARWQGVARNVPVRIIPPKSSSESRAVMTQGTKVMVGDQELKGVVKIVLTAEVNDIWRADITCHFLAQPISALATIHYQKRWWERLLGWIGRTPHGR